MEKENIIKDCNKDSEYFYTKDIDEPLCFIECVQLLDKLVQKGYIQKDPNNKNNILVYREAGTKYPEGWYSENLMSSASELASDIEGQKLLRNTLTQDGVSVQFENVMGAARDFLKPLEEALEADKGL